MKLASIAIAALLSGCALFPEDDHDTYSWIKVAEPLPYVWEVVPHKEVAKRCGMRFIRGEMDCVIRLNDGPNGPYALVLSSVSEEQAKRTYMYTITGAVRTLNKKPETLWLHAMEHVKGYDHGSGK